MDHGVISSWSHIMVGITSFVINFTIMSANAVPGIVSFIVQLQHLTNITVVWQV